MPRIDPFFLSIAARPPSITVRKCSPRTPGRWPLFLAIVITDFIMTDQNRRSAGIIENSRPLAVGGAPRFLTRAMSPRAAATEVVSDSATTLMGAGRFRGRPGD